jgi:hypothetical protein
MCATTERPTAATISAGSRAKPIAAPPICPTFGPLDPLLDVAVADWVAVAFCPPLDALPAGLVVVAVEACPPLDVLPAGLVAVAVAVASGVAVGASMTGPEHLLVEPQRAPGQQKGCVLGHANGLMPAI